MHVASSCFFLQSLSMGFKYLPNWNSDYILHKYLHMHNQEIAKWGTILQNASKCQLYNFLLENSRCSC